LLESTVSPRSFIASRLISQLWHMPHNSKVNVPVKPMQSMHARFEHVVGRPAPEETRAVPFNRLRQLDHTIDRLIRIRDAGARQFGPMTRSKLGSATGGVLGSLSSANPLGRTAARTNPFGWTPSVAIGPPRPLSGPTGRALSRPVNAAAVNRAFSPALAPRAAGGVVNLSV